MALKMSTILVILIILSVCLMAGCINNNGNDDKKNKEPTPIKDILKVNETKLVDLGYSNYSFTITKIENQKVILKIDSNESINRSKEYLNMPRLPSFIYFSRARVKSNI